MKDYLVDLQGKRLIRSKNAMEARAGHDSPRAESTKRESRLRSAILAVTAVSKFKQKKEAARPTSLDLSGCNLR